MIETEMKDLYGMDIFVNSGEGFVGISLNSPTDAVQTFFTEDEIDKFICALNDAMAGKFSSKFDTTLIEIEDFVYVIKKSKMGIKISVVIDDEKDIFRFELNSFGVNEFVSKLVSARDDIPNNTQ